MRPFIEIARFFRPSFAGQTTKVSAVAREHFSSSAKRTNTAVELCSADVTEVLDLSQRISAAKAEPRDGQQALYIKRSRLAWTHDELRKLKDAHDKCMSTKAIAALFPWRTCNSRKNSRQMHHRSCETFADNLAVCLAPQFLRE